MSLGSGDVRRDFPPFLCAQDWDKPEYVQDPDATKPDDWDDDTDGEWEAPMVPNPDYQVGRAAEQIIDLGLALWFILPCGS